MKAPARVNFTRKLQEWDGFGFNYVETSQTVNYQTDPQDYGGFSLLEPSQRAKIIELIFGKDGLKPGVFKMFLDPFQQKKDCLNGHALGDFSLSNYDHETTTKWMRYCMREGLRLTRERGDDLKGIVTMYGPPAFMTKIEKVRGRDLNPDYELECAKYILSFAKYMKDVEKLPIEYMSIHNEGEDFWRWPEDGQDPNIGKGHDYNLYWTAEHAASFIALLGKVAAAVDPELKPTPGECTNWTRFYHWGYADALYENEEAHNSLGLITSHGFYGEGLSKPFSSTHAGTGIALLREKRPELHTWVTSTSWGKMDSRFVFEMQRSIYDAKVNAIIPWAGIQLAGKWVGGDPNPGCAFSVKGKGEYSVEKGYYYYKQLCRAGQPGMHVVPTSCAFTPCAVTAFTGEGTNHPDAIVLVNTSAEPAELHLEIIGGGCMYDAYRTSPDEQYADIGRKLAVNDQLDIVLPADSATTLYRVN